MTSLLLAASPLACVVCYVLGKRRGETRGRELQAMEPPTWGEYHFRDGWISTLYAASPGIRRGRLALLPPETGREMTFDRRAWERAHKRKKTAQRVAARNAAATHCQFGLGAGVCGGKLRDTTDGNGRAVIVCDRCERRKRGICLECNAPVAGKRSIRCAVHQAKARTIYARRHYYRHVEEVRAKAREYATRDDLREKRKLYKRAWRAANPEKVAAQKLRSAIRGVSAEAQRRRRRHKGSPPKRAADLRTCLTPGCEIVVTHRKKKCTKCREAARLAARSILAEQFAA